MSRQSSWQTKLHQYFASLFPRLKRISVVLEAAPVHFTEIHAEIGDETSIAFFRLSTTGADEVTGRVQPSGKSSWRAVHPSDLSSRRAWATSAGPPSGRNRSIVQRGSAVGVPPARRGHAMARAATVEGRFSRRRPLRFRGLIGYVLVVVRSRRPCRGANDEPGPGIAGPIFNQSSRLTVWLAASDMGVAATLPGLVLSRGGG